jgi:hypothetical protein
MADRLDLALVEGDLTRDGLEPAGPMRWLRQSYDDPDGFWPGLLEANSAFFSWPSKSSLYRKYDFYHDIIARNQQNPSAAFRWYRQGAGWQELGYVQLGRLAGEAATRWASLEVGAGNKVCIVSRLNERFLVALLAALKMGLIVSLLEPCGRAFLQKRIEEVAPDFIWTEDEHLPLLSQHRSIILAETGSAGVAGYDSRSHSYSSGEVFALCFDPSSTAPHVPRELGADTAYLCAVRDGMIALGLKPGRELAAPGFNLMETQPALLLACLLNGATFVHIEERDLAKAPEILTSRPLKSVGVTGAVREILAREPVEVGKAWDFWFRNPAESQDIEPWKEFVEVLKLRDVFAGNQRWNASLGGCILFSMRRKGLVHLNVLPSAGVAWHLADLGDGERESLWDHGLFAVKPHGVEGKTGIAAGGLLAEAKKEWMYIGHALSGRFGRHYPVREVLESLLGFPYGPSCSVAEVPPSGAAGSSSFVLLVFVGGGKVNEAQIVEAIKKGILRELGRELLPDRFQMVPLHPRRCEDGSIDHEWCGKEYLSGGLSRRSRGEVYRRITELRDSIYFS